MRKLMVYFSALSCFRKNDAQKKLILKKVLERKYFKKAREINLLTWDAKQQIFYLHKNDPEKWTVQALSESFPISEEGVKRLLKTEKYIIMSNEDIIKHDKKVTTRWKQIPNTAHGNQTGPIKSRYEQLITPKGKNRLLNAAGLVNQPLSNDTKETNVLRTVGPFERIVKDYCESKVKKNRKQIKTEQSDYVKLLQNLTSNITDETDGNGK